MNKREWLEERYQDALFALLMDEVAEAEGKQALDENERLKNDPDFAFPEELDRRCIKTIRRHFMKQSVQKACFLTLKMLKNAMMLAGVVSLLFTSAFAFSETIRIGSINLVMETFEDSTSFHFINRQPNIGPQLTIGWMPDGYALKGCGYDGESSWYQYEKSESEFIRIDYTITAGSVISVDTEDAIIEDVEVQGVSAMLITGENDLQLVWTTDSNTRFIMLMGTGITQKDFVHIANELNY